MHLIIKIFLTYCRSCVECMAFETGPFEKNCSKACAHLKHVMAEKLLKSDCRIKDSAGCWMSFTMKEQLGFDKYDMNVLKDRGIVPDTIPEILKHVLVNWVLSLLTLMSFQTL